MLNLPLLAVPNHTYLAVCFWLAISVFANVVLFLLLLILGGRD